VGFRVGVLNPFRQTPGRLPRGLFQNPCYLQLMESVAPTSELRSSNFFNTITFGDLLKALTLVVSIALAYGALDKRITVLEKSNETVSESLKTIERKLDEQRDVNIEMIQTIYEERQKSNQGRK
jgi:hypothetical protein